MHRLLNEMPVQIDQTVFDAMPCEVAVLNGAGEIVAVNQAWRRCAESSARGDEADFGIGCSYLERMRDPTSSDETATLAKGIEAVLSGTCEQFSTEYLCPSRDQPCWLLISASPIRSTDDSNAPPRGAVVMHVDITDRKIADIARLKRARASLRRRANQLLGVARALKRSNQELDQFAYITSHDLRAPLRGIANLSSWIEEDMADRFTPEGHHQMELLRGRVHRMEALIDAILQFSRVGRVKIRIEPVDVRHMLEEVIDLLAPPEGLKVVIDGQMPAALMTRRVPLQQVFMNLIGNAIKHHDRFSGGNVWICSRDAGDGFIEFSIKDDGPGIAPEYHEKIFVIFQTLSPRDKVEGTGVGLALVRKIVEREGGKVQVESAPGQGATFRFTWPKVCNGD